MAKKKRVAKKKKKAILSIDYSITPELKKRIDALPDWINKSGLWRYLTGENKLIKFKVTKGIQEREWTGSRSAEIRGILNVALPQLEALAKSFEKEMKKHVH